MASYDVLHVKYPVCNTGLWVKISYGIYPARYNLSYNVSNWIHETNDDIKPLDMHAKSF